MSGNGPLFAIGGAGRLVPGVVRDRFLAKLVVTVLLVVVVIAAVGFVGYGQATASVEDDVEAQLTATATMQANTIGDWIEERGGQALMISRSTPVQQGDVEGVSSYFREQWRPEDHRDVRAVHYVDDEDGAVLASTSSIVEGQSFDDLEDPWTDGELFEQASGPGEVAISERAFHNEAFDEDVIAVASPVRGWDDRYVVVLVQVDAQIEGLFQPMDGQTTTILDRSGEPVLTPAGGADLDVPFDLTERDDGTATFREADDTVYAYAPIEGTDWVAVTAVPTSSAYAVSDAVARSVLSIVAVALVSLLLAAIVVGRQTVTPLTALRETVARMEQGDLNVDLETGRTDEIGQLYGGFATMRDSLREQIREAESAREAAETARQEAEEMNEHLEAKADEYNRVIDDWADGDLTGRLDPQSHNEAMTGIAHRLNDMVDDLEVAIDDVKQFASETAAASEQATASTQEVRAASQQVTESIQEISAGAERQNDKLVTIAQEMNNLSATTEEIASLSTQVADIAGRTAETGQEGRQAATEAIEAMDEIQDASEYAVGEIRTLEREEVGQIDDLIEQIREIAEQTNMLALNANIEASRSTSGSDEGGFGAVAQEVKELSEDAKAAADEIERRLEAIREQTETSAEEVERTSDLIREASERVQETVDGLEEIAEYAEETNTGVQEINDVTEAQADSADEVVTQVEEVTTISEETTAEAETVASAAEEQTASLVETSKSVENLSRRATQLSEALDRFDTEVDDVQRDEADVAAL